MNLSNLEKILQNPDTELKAQIQNQMRAEQLKQAINQSVCMNTKYSGNASPQHNIELAMSDVSILNHLDPDIARTAGWIRQEDYQKAIDGLKKCMDSIDFPRSFAQATLIDLKEL